MKWVRATNSKGDMYRTDKIIAVTDTQFYVERTGLTPFPVDHDAGTSAAMIDRIERA